MKRTSFKQVVSKLLARSLVIKVCSPLLTPLLWNDKQQTYSFEVEAGGINETKDKVTDRTEHTMIVPFFVLDE